MSPSDDLSDNPLFRSGRQTYSDTPAQSFPFSEDAEKGLLSSLLQAPGEVATLCTARLTIKHFYIPAHAILYETILRWNKPDQQVDFVWLKEQLKADKQLEEVGGADAVSALYNFVPTHENADFYLGVIRKTYARRTAIILSDEFRNRCEQDEDPQIVLAEFEKQLKYLRHANNGATTRPIIEFLKPSAIKAYVPPPGCLLVGDNHIVRGGISIIAGPPGVGKSRSLVALAEAGATRLDWLGSKVHCNFRTMIIQNENGRYRLKLEFAELDERLLDKYLLISPPPPFGLCFNKAEFRDELKAGIDTFQPAVIAIDPWNAVSRDDKQKDYRETFDLLRDVIPAGDDAPAINIVAHTRKPLPNERTNGRALLNLLAGSYMLASVPRTVWVLQHASDDVSETRVVVTCCKNNDGALGDRSVWTRDNGLWTQVTDFNWHAWDNQSTDTKAKAISETDVAEIFDNGELTKADAVSALMKLTGFKQTACYEALDPKGRFSKHLRYNPKAKTLRWL